MTKDNKLEQREYDKYYELKEYLGRLQDEYQTCHTRYMNESDTRQRAMARKDLDEISLRIRRTQQEMNKIKNLIHLKDSIDMLKLSGFTMDEEEMAKDDLSSISKHWNKATIEHILKNAHLFKPEVVEEAKRLSKIVKDACSAKDDKFEVMYTIGHFHDPETLKDKKEIIQANSAGEARRMIENKWKGNLNRIIQITQVHDSACGEKIFTKGKENEMAKDEDAKSIESRLDFLEKKIRGLGNYGDKYTRQRVEGYKEEYDRLVKKLQGMNKTNKDDDATEGGAVREYGDKEEKMEDACSAKDANYSGWSKRDISYDLRSKEDFLRSLEDDLRSGEYDGTVRGIKSPEALKSLIRKTKQEIEEAKRAMSNAKDADPKVAEAEAIIRLCGGVM